MNSTFIKKILKINLHSLTSQLRLTTNSFLTPKHLKSKRNLNFDWENKNFNRISAVNLAIMKSNKNQPTYLEIGCAGNSTFNSVPVLNKIGVDPNRGGTHRMTSDEFFAINTSCFDVIFIDGFHTYYQVKKDAINSSSCLNDNGIILLHDFLPLNWKAAIPNDLRQVSSAWNGDLFKFAFELIHYDINFHILNIDEGIMVIHERESILKLKELQLISDTRFIELTFDYYLENYNTLPIIEFDEFINKLEVRK